jgi:hypothetical protein
MRTTFPVLYLYLLNTESFLKHIKNQHIKIGPGLIIPYQLSLNATTPMLARMCMRHVRDIGGTLN